MGGIPLDEWSGAGATKALTKVVEENNEITRRQTEKMVTLTRWITGMTFVLVGFGVIQLVLLIVQLKLIVN